MRAAFLKQFFRFSDILQEGLAFLSLLLYTAEERKVFFMMKKRICALALLLVLVLTFAACGKTARGYTVVVPYDAHYSEKEIRAAMRVAVRHFEKEFDGCTLLSICYEENKVKDAEPGWAAQYDADEAIVLLSSFHVDGSGGDGSFNANSDYTDWHWVLVRSGGGSWQLKTWGY